MKKLIVLATLAALPAAAMADVVISGDLGVSIANTKTKDKEEVKPQTSANSMNRTTGQIVFSSKEDLGNGLKAIWQVASRIDGSGDEKNTWGQRDTYIGLAGDFGTVKFGRLSNPTNSGYGSADPFQEINIQGDGVYEAGETRLNNAVRYDSPVVAGFSGAVAVQLKPEKKLDDVSGQKVAPYGYGFGLGYAAGPVEVTYARAVAKNQFDGALNGLFEVFPNADGDYESVGFADTKTTYNRASAVYSEDALTVGLHYGDAKVSGKGSAVKQRGYGVHAAYSLGQITPMVSFWREGKAKIDGETVAGSYSVVSLGADYALSKRTSAGVEFQFQGGRKDELSGEKFGKKQISAVYLTTKF